MATPVTFKELSKRVSIRRGDREIGTVRYVPPRAGSKPGWVFYLAAGAYGTPRLTWTEAANDVRAYLRETV